MKFTLKHTIVAAGASLCLAFAAADAGAYDRHNDRGYGGHRSDHGHHHARHHDRYHYERHHHRSYVANYYVPQTRLIYQPAAVVSYAPQAVYGGGYQRGPNFGNAVGGAVGGLVGAQIGRGSGQLATTAAGAVIGYVIGGRVADPYR